jgi:hypothetical protein
LDAPTRIYKEARERARCLFGACGISIGIEANRHLGEISLYVGMDFAGASIYHVVEVVEDTHETSSYETMPYATKRGEGHDRMDRERGCSSCITVYGFPF